MGDGGVACMPSQHVMERLPMSDKYCRGNGGFSSKYEQQQQQIQRKNDKRMVVEKEDFRLASSVHKVSLEEEECSSVNDREIENGEIVPDKMQKDEVEEGEVGSGKELRLEVENGEFIPDKFPRREIEKGEFIPGKWRRGEVERGEFIPDKRPKWEVEKVEFNGGRRLASEIEKGEFVPDKWRKREVPEYGSARRGQRGELERGEFVPYKPRKEDFGSTKGPKSYLQRDEYGNDKGRAFERERTSASTRLTEEDAYHRKDLSRTDTEWTKKYPRWEPGHNRDTKTGFRAADDERGLLKRETNDGKNYGKDYSSPSWLKRQTTDTGNNGRRYSGEFSDQNSKSRRIYEDNNGSAYFEKHPSQSSAEKYRNGSSSRLPSSTRYSSSKHYDSSTNPRRAHDRLGPNPGYFERSPHDRPRYHDNRDRSPVSERSPNEQARYHDHRNRSPLKKSPYQSRNYDRRDRSPGYLDRSPVSRGRSPHARGRQHDSRDRSPGYLANSPLDYDRSSHHDCRDRTPGYLEKSPLDRDSSPYLRARHHNGRDRTPNHLERSPLTRGRPHDYQEDSRTRKRREDVHISAEEQDDELKPHSGRNLPENSSTVEPQFKCSLDSDRGSVDANHNDQSIKEEKPQTLIADCADPPQVSDAVEEMSMEEDMDISNTPPHVPVMNDSALGNWFYLDHFGVEQGPSKLCNLRRLVEEGVIQSDHLVKHSGSDWWVTVENAASPSVPTNFPSIVSEMVSQLVSPPEAPGNLLQDSGDAGEPANKVDQETLDDSLNVVGYLEDLHIDERVNALLDGYAIVPGRELETLGEALHMDFELTDWEKWGYSEGVKRSRSCTREPYGHQRDEFDRSLEITSKDVLVTRSNAPCNKEYTFSTCNSSDWFSGRWSCKGGDWKRNDDANQDKSSRRKLVLNDGYPVCQMPKSGYEDPRWCRRDELYYPSRSRKLNLPSWAFSLTEDKNDSNITSKTSQTKTPMKGTLLPVVRINACVVNNQISPVSEPRRGNERHSSRSSRSFSSGKDGRSSSAEDGSRSKCDSEQKCITPIIAPKDRVCTVQELQLHLGEWYYYDGAGHEHGPSSFVELQALVENGTIQKYTSVFRKFDNIWVPVSYTVLSAKPSVSAQDLEVVSDADTSAAPPSQEEVSRHDVADARATSFHHLHPQFIGYTRGKLHELVMKSYKSREFAAAINEVLDPWINAKQPKKELELMQMFRTSDDDYIPGGKRARLMGDSEDDYDLEGDVLRDLKDDCMFDDLCGDTTFSPEMDTRSDSKSDSWGLLNGTILARVFHFLRADMKSIVFSAATCRHWNAAAKFYRDISKQVDLSDMGPDCTDSMFRTVMGHYDTSKITSIILRRCANINAKTLEEILLSFPCISSIDIRGCMQFRELPHRYQKIKWVSSRALRDTKNSEDLSSKSRCLKHLSEEGHSFLDTFKSSAIHSNEFNEGAFRQHGSYLDGRGSTSRSFRQSSYKRKKLLDSKKTLSRDARLKQWLYRKSENGYKRMEEFLALSLKDIMKENTFDYFVPKVAEIQVKMKNGYYSGRGLGAVKEDISRMCRDAMKAKNRGGAEDMNEITVLFISLATQLEEYAQKPPRERDELLKSLKDKTKKKHLRLMNEKKSTRSNGNVYSNGGSDYGGYASDRELRRRLSKLNKRPFESESETSDDSNQSSEDSGDDSENTISDTESITDVRSEGGMRGGFFMDDEDDSTTDDREWGARMTKASLVPPVTRKYEVIERYLILADEEEVQRKMQVSLPEDYAEKLSAQKNGADESDMGIPEVKDYKPRKQVGEEVLEQEVYGIDPYTHNLLLDSMPDELDWPLSEKHIFIEDTLLRALNMQVRHYTGTGNAPMKYPLQSVIEEIQAKSEKDGDKRIMKMCHSILKAIRCRPEDNYVAYRKGLGVVCNTKEGFAEDDFVVEFLGEVYPVWKWFEKQDGIRELQKDSKDPAPEFYNIYLERPKGDRDGYDLVVVDAMHKANYASRICHSCRPNCEAKVTAVDGQYQIGVYTVRPIGYAEEVTFDYNSVTESKEEYEQSVCLCGSQICRGSFLNLTGEGAYQKVIMECHGILDRHRLMLEACESNFVSEEDYVDLGRAGLGTCLLAGLPVWLIAYSAQLVRFINFERTKLPEAILKHNLDEKSKYLSDIPMDVEKNDAEVQAEGVYSQRLQNLAVTLDKVRYVMRKVYRDPEQAPAPLQRLSPEEIVSVIWKGEGSLVEELLECMAPHTEDNLLKDLRSKIQDHDPSGADHNLMGALRKSLLWLRDEVRNLPCTYKCRHDAAADLIHVYAYTKCFFRVQEYEAFESPPVFISPLDVGPKYAEKLGSGVNEYCKKYGENYCLGQLIYWHSQDNANPDSSLSRARRGCLSLPEVGSFYAKANKPSCQRVYGPKMVKFMLSRMEKHSQKPWPKDKIWSFKSESRIFGSPMLDAVVNKSPLDREMVNWLKNRPPIFQAKWDS
ncbi:hypothetical protein ACHQM5_003804 [Ranunculus cassubicifolius]